LQDTFKRRQVSAAWHMRGCLSVHFRVEWGALGLHGPSTPSCQQGTEPASCLPLCPFALFHARGTITLERLQWEHKVGKSWAFPNGSLPSNSPFTIAIGNIPHMSKLTLPISVVQQCLPPKEPASSYPCFSQPS